MQGCHGGVTADVMGWLKLGPMDAGGTEEGAHKSEHMQNIDEHESLPRFRALVRR